jgi:hypothetical protein
LQLNHAPAPAIARSSRLALPLVVASIGFAQAPAFASACEAAAGREQLRDAGRNYERIPFTASVIDRRNPRFAWTSEWGDIRLERGTILSSTDRAIYQIERYMPVFSLGRVGSGQYIHFMPVSSGDRTLVEIRLAAAPLMDDAASIESRLSEPRPRSAPEIPGYRFQMAEDLVGMSRTYLGLWRRTGSSGARTLLVIFSPNRDSPGGYATRIVGRSDLAFSLISQIDTIHGGDWSFTLFTEADCPGRIEMLSYLWHLYIPRTGQ